MRANVADPDSRRCTRTAAPGSATSTAATERNWWSYTMIRLVRGTRTRPWLSGARQESWFTTLRPAAEKRPSSPATAVRSSLSPLHLTADGLPVARSTRRSCSIHSPVATPPIRGYIPAATERHLGSLTRRTEGIHREYRATIRRRGRPGRDGGGGTNLQCHGIRL